MRRMEPRREVITLDGPAASGKTSVAREVARRLAIPFVSSGLLYRAATLVAERAGVGVSDQPALLELLRRHEVRLQPSLEGDLVRVDGRDVTRALHTDAVDGAVSGVAAQPGVRAWVGRRLREIPGAFVIDGRDMGTAVFSDAQHKFYLTAPAEVRARRRVGERSADLAAVEEGIRRRDALDARQSAPAADAVVIDTGALTLEQVVDAVMAVVSGVESA